MNRTKYRICLIFLILAAIVFGIAYYVYLEKEENTITDGTFVYRLEEETGKEMAAEKLPSAGKELAG